MRDVGTVIPNVLSHPWKESIKQRTDFRISTEQDKDNTSSEFTVTEWKNRLRPGMMFCGKAFLSGENWDIYNLVLEDCQGFNAVPFSEEQSGNCCH